MPNVGTGRTLIDGEHVIHVRTTGLVSRSPFRFFPALQPYHDKLFDIFSAPDYTRTGLGVLPELDRVYDGEELKGIERSDRSGELLYQGTKRQF